VKTYTLIGTSIQAFTNAKTAKKAIALAPQEPKILLSSLNDLASADIASNDLVAIWNALPSVQPVKKFTSRKVAVERIWTAIEGLEPDTAADSAPRSEKAAKRRVKAGERTDGATAPKTSKKTAVLELLRRPNGVTLDELMAATGWQAHSVRGFLSGTVRKKMGLEPERFRREDKSQAYRIAQ
jgi:hypothetical protein